MNTSFDLGGCVIEDWRPCTSFVRFPGPRAAAGVWPRLGQGRHDVVFLGLDVLHDEALELAGTLQAPLVLCSRARAGR